MIAYNHQSLDNLDLQQQAREAFEKQLISLDEYDRIRAAFPYSFFIPDIFVRIGLFLLTAIAAAAVLGLFLLAGLGGGEQSLSISFFLLGIVTVVVLELFIRQRKMKGSGVDDALLWFAILMLLGGINSSIVQKVTPATESGLVLILALIAILRYADHGMTLVAYGAFLCLIFYTVAQWGSVARALLPFLIMGLSIGCYFLFSRLHETSEARHYHSCLQLLRFATLLSLYAAGNNYIVRELNTVISAGHGPIPFGWLWWAFTALIPIAYIIKGVWKKDILFLWTGMALAAASILTIRYYYHLLPAEIVMIMGGIVLIAAVYGLSRYLRTPKKGFTAAASDQQHSLGGLPVEGLIIAESFSGVTARPADGGTHFGGGDTGAGGAGGQY
jgi:hypothetical protein